MKSLAIMVVASVTVFSLACASPSPPSLSAATIVMPTAVQLTSEFQVDFQGIITHVQIRDPKTGPRVNERRAVAISGDIGRQHTPQLAVVVPEDPALRRDLITSLRDATGKVPKCNEDQCFVAIHGVAMRIRGDGNTSPKGTLDVHPSFGCLVPRLSYPPINGKAILSELEMPAPADPAPAHLPSMPATAFFEIENGMLSASRFELTGYFKDEDFLKCEAACKSDPVCIEKCVGKAECREFPAGVRWRGETDGPARLQLASNHTAWRWETIPVANEGALTLFVVNLADRGHASSEHFTMNAKLLTNKRVPDVGVGCGNSDLAACAIGPGPTAILAIPGCTDNQWP